MKITKEKKVKLKVAHGFMNYECDSCKRIFVMLLETGIEDFSENHKPSPFTIKCPFCSKGLAHDVTGLVEYSRNIPIENGDRYFANVEGIDYGVPTLCGLEIEKAEFPFNLIEELEKEVIKEMMNEKGFTAKEIPPKKHDYDFSKVNLKNLSKKQLIRIIYDLKERLDMYETN